jgi:hypothetical protein
MIGSGLVGFDVIAPNPKIRDGAITKAIARPLMTTAVTMICPWILSFLCLLKMYPVERSAMIMSCTIRLMSTGVAARVPRNPMFDRSGTAIDIPCVV